MQMNRKDIISFLRSVFDSFNDGSISEAYLFGSYARGDYNAFSDLDIAVYTENYMLFCKICNFIENKLDVMRKLDIHMIQKNNFDKEFIFDEKEIKSGIRLC